MLEVITQNSRSLTRKKNKENTPLAQNSYPETQDGHLTYGHIHILNLEH